MAFTQKKLRATISLANGQFEGGGNSLTVSDMRMSADIRVMGGDGQSMLDALTIYGLSLSQMNRLSTVGRDYNRINEKNTVTVEAGDDQSGMATIFQGNIYRSWVDASNMPEVRFVVQGAPTGAAARKPVAVTSRKGAIAGESLIQSLAQQMGFQFENNGVHVMLANPYLWGTAISQVRQAVEAMGCQWLVHNGTLAIWPTGKSRQGDPTLFSPQTGMVGYPSFDVSTIHIVSQFNPAYKPGTQFKVQSSLTAANGAWNFSKLEYGLDAYTPHGRWFMLLSGTVTGSTPPGGAND